MISDKWKEEGFFGSFILGAALGAGKAFGPMILSWALNILMPALLAPVFFPSNPGTTGYPRSPKRMTARVKQAST